MKHHSRILFMILISLTTYSSNAQWYQLGAGIYGEVEFEFSGHAVDLNATGSRLIVGSPESNTTTSGPGRASVYEFENGEWVQLGSDIIGDGFNTSCGRDVSINDGGDVIAVAEETFNSDGISNVGRVRIFGYDGSEWIQWGEDILGENYGDFLGSSIAMNEFGNRVAVAIPGLDEEGSFYGGVQIYQYWDGTWSQVGETIVGPPDYTGFGYTVEMNAAGNRVVVSATSDDTNAINSGKVQVFEHDGTSWNQIGQDIYGQFESEEFGYSLSTSSSGDIIAIGTPKNSENGNWSGLVETYSLIDGEWVQFGSDIHGELQSRLGDSISLNAAGSKIAVGSPTGGEGKVEMFTFDGIEWVPCFASLTGSPYSSFGREVSLDNLGETLAIGAPGDDEAYEDAGKVCVFSSTACLGDLDGDGAVGTNDVLTIFPEWNCTSGCQYDLNCDGQVGTSDLLIIIAAFGLICP